MFRVIIYDDKLGRQIRYFKGTDILSVLEYCVKVEHLNVIKITNTGIYEEDEYESDDES